MTLDEPDSNPAAGRERPWREATRAPAWRGERALAVAVALLVNALAAFGLLRVPELRTNEAALADEPIEVVWIERPGAPSHPAAVPAVPVESEVPEVASEPEALAEPESGSPPAAVTAPEPPAEPSPPMWGGGQIPADEEPPPDLPPGEDENGRPIVAGPDARERDTQPRPGVFAPKPDNPFVREEDGPYRMQDNSLGGRLQRMAKRSTCGELRAQLRAGGADIEAIVRAMAELRCS